MGEKPDFNDNAVLPWVGAAFSLAVAVFLLVWGMQRPDPVEREAIPEQPDRDVSGQFSQLTTTVPIGAHSVVHVRPDPEMPRDVATCIHVEMPRVTGAFATPHRDLWSDIPEADIVWRPTPFSNAMLPPAAALCAQGWSDRMSVSLVRAMQSPRSWFAQVADRNILLVYSLPQRAMFRIDAP